MKKIYRIKTLFRYCILVFVLLFIQIINVEATEKNEKPTSFIDKLEKNRSFAGSEGWEKMQLNMMQGKYGYSGQLAHLYYTKEITGSTPVFIATLLYTSYYAVPQLYSDLTNYMDNKQIREDLEDGCRNLYNDIISKYESENKNKKVVIDFAKDIHFHVCNIYDRDNGCGLSDIFAKKHIYINTFNNGSIRFGNNQTKFDIGLNEVEKYSPIYNNTKLNIAMNAGCINPFGNYKDRYCCNIYLPYNFPYNIFRKGKYAKMINGFKLYGEDRVRYSISNIYNITITKQHTCYDMTTPEGQDNDYCTRRNTYKEDL